MAPSKNIRMSDNQKQYLLDYMIEQPVLATNRLTGLAGRAKAQEMWEELAIELNAVRGGANKSVQKWKLSWIDWKLNTRNKANNIAQYECGNAEGDAPPSKLSPIEEKLIAFLDHEIRTQSSVAVDRDYVGPNYEEVVYSHDGSMEEFTEATVAADNVLVYKVDMESIPASVNSTPGTPGDVLHMRPGSDLYTEGVPTSVATQQVTSDVSSIKRKMSPMNAYSQPSLLKRRPPADHASYAHPNEHSAVLRQIRDSLRDLNRAGLRKTAACERRAAASERIAAATERKAAACERKAAAFERIAAAKEHKYCVQDGN